MVEDPAEYIWSSYQCNALGKESTLLKPHELYLALGEDSEERMRNYRGLFKSHVDGDLLDDIRKVTNKGLVLGSDRFVDELERLSGQQLREGKKGRPQHENVL